MLYKVLCIYIILPFVFSILPLPGGVSNMLQNFSQLSIVKNATCFDAHIDNSFTEINIARTKRDIAMQQARNTEQLAYTQAMQIQNVDDRRDALRSDNGVFENRVSQIRNTFQRVLIHYFDPFELSKKSCGR